MSDELVKQWGEYVESMGSVMGDVEHIAQQMCDRIEQLTAERDKWKAAFDESCNAWQQQCEYEMDRAKKAEAERDRAEDELYELQQTCITLRGENETLTAEREALEQDNHRWKMECENFWRDREKDLNELLEEAQTEWSKYASAWMTAEGKLEDAVQGLEKCQAELDAYSRQEYPLDHSVHERYRQRDYDANPARITIAALKGETP